MNIKWLNNKYAGIIFLFLFFAFSLTGKEKSKSIYELYPDSFKIWIEQCDVIDLNKITSAYLRKRKDAKSFPGLPCDIDIIRDGKRFKLNDSTNIYLISLKHDSLASVHFAIDSIFIGEGCNLFLYSDLQNPHRAIDDSWNLNEEEIKRDKEGKSFRIKRAPGGYVGRTHYIEYQVPVTASPTGNVHIYLVFIYYKKKYIYKGNVYYSE